MILFFLYTTLLLYGLFMSPLLFCYYSIKRQKALKGTHSCKMHSTYLALYMHEEKLILKYNTHTHILKPNKPNKYFKSVNTRGPFMFSVYFASSNLLLYFMTYSIDERDNHRASRTTCCLSPNNAQQEMIWQISLTRTTHTHTRKTFKK